MIKHLIFKPSHSILFAKPMDFRGVSLLGWAVGEQIKNCESSWLFNKERHGTFWIWYKKYNRNMDSKLVSQHRLLRWNSSYSSFLYNLNSRIYLYSITHVQHVYILIYEYNKLNFFVLWTWFWVKLFTNIRHVYKQYTIKNCCITLSKTKKVF